MFVCVCNAIGIGCAFKVIVVNVTMSYCYNMNNEKITCVKFLQPASKAITFTSAF